MAFSKSGLLLALLVVAASTQDIPAPFLSSLWGSYGENANYPDGTWVYGGTYGSFLDCQTRCPFNLVSDSRAFDGHSYYCTASINTGAGATSTYCYYMRNGESVAKSLG